MVDTTGSAETHSRAWQIYDDHRTAVFNSKYFETKVSHVKTGAMYLDILIAVGTSTTGIAGWALWNEPGFKIVWIALAGLAGTLAVVKPVLKLDDKLVLFTRLFSEHGRVAKGFTDLVADIKARQSLDGETFKRFDALRSTTSAIELVPLGPRRLEQKIQNQINEEWPVSRYWSPSEGSR
jgi:hypothetical protein